MSRFRILRIKRKKEIIKTIFINGCFDIIHLGHIEYLNDARSFGTHLIVGVNTDASVRKLKGDDRPINSENDRAKVLDSLTSVDGVVLFDEETPIDLIQLVQPDVLVKGGDYTLDSIVGAHEVLTYGGRVEIIPFLEGYSTSKIISKIIAHAK